MAKSFRTNTVGCMASGQLRFLGLIILLEAISSEAGGVAQRFVWRFYRTTIQQLMLVGLYIEQKPPSCQELARSRFDTLMQRIANDARE